MMCTLRVRVSTCVSLHTRPSQLQLSRQDPDCDGNHVHVTGVKKMTAKAAKTVKYGSSVDGISTAEPDQYSKRFLAFMGDAIE